jgi:hypothetical protein
VDVTDSRGSTTPVAFRSSDLASLHGLPLGTSTVDPTVNEFQPASNLELDRNTIANLVITNRVPAQYAEVGLLGGTGQVHVHNLEAVAIPSQCANP